MKITALKEKPEITDKSLEHAYSQFANLLEELRKRELPPEITSSINEAVEEVNAATATHKILRTLISKKHAEILAMVKEKLQLVPKNHFTSQWMVLGMSVFGLPIGVIYGTIADNIGLLAIGLPIGMGVGILAGMRLDKKVEKEGRQLDLN